MVYGLDESKNVECQAIIPPNSSLKLIILIISDLCLMPKILVGVLVRGVLVSLL
jgi:hypothetical protein